MTWRFLSELFSGNGDPLWTHALLLSGDVGATIVVGAGKMFESNKYSSAVLRVANLLVIFGIAAETLCSILLFAYDEGISSAQQLKIIDLESQIAPRLLALKECQDIAHSMKPSAGKKVRVESYGGDAEGSNLAAEIIVCLEGAKTVEVDHGLASILPLGGFGSGVFVDGTDKKLVGAIRDALGIKAKLVISPGTGWFPGNISSGRGDPSKPPPNANVIVGVKPVPPITIK